MVRWPNSLSANTFYMTDLDKESMIMKIEANGIQMNPVLSAAAKPS